MKKTTFLVIAAILFSSFIPLLVPPQSSEAAFKKNKVISDSVLNFKNSMGAKQINNFLNKRSGSCISPNSGFRAKKPTGYNPSEGFKYGSYAGAGGVIVAAAQAYNINPQVLLATLQKEQSLVTGGGPNGCGAKAMAAAMGFNCPDGGSSYNYSGTSLYMRNGNVISSVNGTCVNSKASAGFSQQTIRAAWRLKFNQQRSKGNYNWAIVKGSWDNSDDPSFGYNGPMTEGNHKRHKDSPKLYYDGRWTIDGESVYMTYGGTASFYYYTPHFHGNKLFVNIFESWFGSTLKIACTSSDSPSKHVFRSYNGKKHRHFFTRYECERDVISHYGVYDYEGIAFNDATGSSKIPVYRLHDKRSGYRFWTKNKNERDYLINKHGWGDDGVGFYGYDKNATDRRPVYRLYHKRLRVHLYTVAKSEISSAKEHGYKYEGVAFFAPK